jgi:hypothetical protein
MRALPFIFFIFFLSTIHSAYANKFDGKINWDTKWYPLSGSESYGLSHVDETSAYFIHINEADYYLQKYSLADFSLQKSTLIDGFHKKDILRMLRICQLEETLFLICRINDSKKNLTYDFVRRIDKETLALSERYLISNKDKVKSLSGTTNYESHRWFGNFPSGLIYSKDRETAFITESANNKDIGKDLKGIKMIGRIIDPGLIVNEQSNYELLHKDAWIENIQLSNDGLVYFLYRGKSKKAKLLAGYDNYGALELAVLDPKTGSMNTTVIPEDEGTRILSSHLMIDKDGGITVAGINFEDKYFAKNIFVTKLTNDLQQEFYEFHPLNEEFKPQFSGDDFDKPNKTLDKKRINYSYDVKDFIENPNGTTTYLIEKNFFRVQDISPDHNGPNSGMQTHSVTYEFFYDDIIAINFNSDGTINWQTVIEKRQVTLKNYDSSTSFHHTVDNGEITIFYNESVYEQNKNVSASIKEKKKLREKNVGIQVVLDSDGNFTKQEIYSDNIDPDRVAMTTFYPISKNKAVIVIKKSVRESLLKKDVRSLKYGIVTW